jgi:hypothetical protein
MKPVHSLTFRFCATNPRDQDIAEAALSLFAQQTRGPSQITKDSSGSKPLKATDE